MKTDLSLKKINLFKKDIFSYHQDIYVKERSLSLNSINDYLIKNTDCIVKLKYLEKELHG